MSRFQTSVLHNFWRTDGSSADMNKPQTSKQETPSTSRRRTHTHQFVLLIFDRRTRLNHWDDIYTPSIIWRNKNMQLQNIEWIWTTTNAFEKLLQNKWNGARFGKMVQSVDLFPWKEKMNSTGFVLHETRQCLYLYEELNVFSVDVLHRPEQTNS